MSVKKKVPVFLIFSSALAGVSFWSRHTYVFLAPYLLILGYYWVEISGPKLYKKLLLTWASGLVFFMTLQTWMITVNLAGLNIKDTPSIILFKALVWLCSCIFWSVGFLLLPLIYLTVRSIKQSLPIKYALFSISWILSEFARSYLFSVFNYGQGSSIGANWSFGALGLGFIDSPLKYSSRIVGLYGLSLIVTVLTFTFYLYFRKKLSKKIFAIAVSGVFLITTFGYLWPKQTRPFQHQVTIVHAPFNQEYRYPVNFIFRSYPSETKGTRIVIFPEASGIFKSTGSKTRREPILKSFPTPNGSNLFIDTNEKILPEGRTIALGLYNQNGEALLEKTKNILIPGGEYIPYYVVGLIKASGHADLIEPFNNTRKLFKGSDDALLAIGPEKIGAYACSSIISPEKYRKATKDGATLLVNSADLGFFNMSPSYLEQNLKFAKFHAVANSRPFVQSARQGVSFLLDSDGQVIDHLKNSAGLSVKNYDIYTNDDKTAYTLYGDVIIYVLVLSTSLAAINKYQFAIKQHQKRLRNILQKRW